MPCTGRGAPRAAHTRASAAHPTARPCRTARALRARPALTRNRSGAGAGCRRRAWGGPGRAPWPGHAAAFCLLVTAQLSVSGLNPTLPGPMNDVRHMLCCTRGCPAVMIVQCCECIMHALLSCRMCLQEFLRCQQTAAAAATVRGMASEADQYSANPADSKHVSVLVTLNPCTKVGVQTVWRQRRTSRFSGLTSRWVTLAACSAASASSVWRSSSRRVSSP